jgi:adenylosuccinate synthase
VAIRVAGPNAGHTVVAEDGRPWPLRCVPVAAVVNPDATLAIAAGSEIDREVLAQEVNRLEDAGYKIRNRLFIDPAATVLEPHHVLVERASGLETASGSTVKGIGAARAERIMRRATTVRQVADLFEAHGAVADVSQLARGELRQGARVLVEGTQGYGLGLHTGYYPYTTSQDCRAIDFLAQAGISPWDPAIEELKIWLLFRPYPIRIAGNSGPLYNETTWGALGLPEEKTTVTQKVRRVGRWDGNLAWAAVRANGGPAPNVNVVLTMGDHVDPGAAGVTEWDKLPAQLLSFIDGQVEYYTRSRVQMVGTGPGTVAVRP